MNPVNVFKLFSGQAFTKFSFKFAFICEIYAVCENWLEHIILENISGSANLIP